MYILRKNLCNNLYKMKNVMFTTFLQQIICFKLLWVVIMDQKVIFVVDSN